MSAKRLLTPDDFRTWQDGNEQLIRDTLAANQAAVDDAVVRQLMDGCRRGMSVDAAGDVILRQFAYGTRGSVVFTPDGVKDALRHCGWKPAGGHHE
ncbi:hypothetical protein ISN75_12890 [Dyella marensis]|uniref:hypothetical protein n=1 Tax=Dyella marensis TaxID=500610 RepID=UPI0031D32C16